MPKEYMDLTPSPRLLSMLGKLPMEGWQCIAELCDNSIDAMLEIKDLDSTQKNKISIKLPSEGDITNNIPLVISDNGAGMTKSQLNKALTAGISGKTSDSDLGLFGMGFNIATSRLAYNSTVWTSTKELDHDIGVTINLPEMTKKQSFKSLVSKRKNSETSAKGKHGTTIEIKDYKPEAKTLLYRPKLIRKLNNVYSSIISEKYNIDIQATDNRGWVPIEPKRFCIWDENRTVQHKKEGEIKPYYTFESEISKSPYCTICLYDLETESVDKNSTCPICGNNDSIITKINKVHGWVGIQRYFSEKEYGFDIVRNGRIIKEWDKSLFTWHDRSKQHESILDYPIDNKPLGGRIVGEIHTDFIIPEFTKDNFATTEDWFDAVEVIRGDKPLQPLIAKRLSLGSKNRSPLAMLFYGFRKTTPGRKDLVCGVTNGGANAGNRRALEYKRSFYEGDEEFRSDEKWYDLVLLAEEGENTDGPDIPGPEDPPPNETPPSETENPYPGTITHIDEIVFDLGRKIDAPPITTKIYEYNPLGQIEFNPVIFDAESSNVYHVRLNQRHNMIKDFEEGWQDLVTMEIAAKFHSQLFNTEEWPISKIYYELKLKYFPERILNIDNIVASAKQLIRDLHNYLINESIEMKPKPNLPPSLLEKLKNEYRDIENKNLKKPGQVLKYSSYVKYLDLKYLHDFIREYPNLIFDGKFLALSYEEFDNDPEYQSTLLDDYFAHFANVAWITEILSDMNDVKRKKNKSKIISAKLALEHLLEKRV